MSKICVSCGEEIHPGRLKALPTAKTCVECSTTGKKAGVTVTLGEGDHTYNEIIIMEHDEFIKYKEIEDNFRNKVTTSPKAEINSLDRDEEVTEVTPEIYSSEDLEEMKEWDVTLLDGIEETETEEDEDDDLIDEEENA
jgi:hypothetical protein